MNLLHLLSHATLVVLILAVILPVKASATPFSIGAASVMPPLGKENKTVEIVPEAVVSGIPVSVEKKASNKQVKPSEDKRKNQQSNTDLVIKSEDKSKSNIEGKKITAVIEKDSSLGKAVAANLTNSTVGVGISSHSLSRLSSSTPSSNIEEDLPLPPGSGGQNDVNELSSHSVKTATDGKDNKKPPEDADKNQNQPKKNEHSKSDKVEKEDDTDDIPLQPEGVDENEEDAIPMVDETGLTNVAPRPNLKQNPVIPDTSIQSSLTENKQRQTTYYRGGSDLEEESGGYFNYFIFFITILALAFLIFHNKRRLMAYVVEGRKPRGGSRSRRRSTSASGASYRPLENNFE